MKRVNSFLIAAFVAASSMFVVSCGGDDEVDPPDVSIKYSFVNADGSTTSNTAQKNDEITLAPEGATIKFEVSFIKGTEKMSSILVESKLENSQNTYKIIDVSGMADGIFNFRGGNKLDTVFSTNVGKVKETFTFTITDTKTNSDVFTLTVTPKTLDVTPPASGDQYTYTRKGATTFGAQSDPTNPSFYSVADSKTMNLSTARSNAGKVNLAFFYSTAAASSGAGVGNPGNGNSSVANAIQYGTTANTTSTWTCAATTLAKVAAASSTTLNDAWWQSGVTALASNNKDVTGLAANDAVFFKVGSDVYAFIVVTPAASASGSFIVQFVDRKSIN